jgi:hypothetical protein
MMESKETDTIKRETQYEFWLDEPSRMHTFQILSPGRGHSCLGFTGEGDEFIGCVHSGHLTQDYKDAGKVFAGGASFSPDERRPIQKETTPSGYNLYIDGRGIFEWS